MKSLNLLLITLLLANFSYAQEAIQLQVSDTRFINEAPGDFRQITRFDFKQKARWDYFLVMDFILQC